MKVKYLVTMLDEISFEDVEILNCSCSETLNKRIANGEVIEINENGTIYYINSSYIAFWC